MTFCKSIESDLLENTRQVNQSPVYDFEPNKYRLCMRILFPVKAYLIFTDLYDKPRGYIWLLFTWAHQLLSCSKMKRRVG